jgi:hypothetical protein
VEELRRMGVVDGDGERTRGFGGPETVISCLGAAVLRPG